MAAGDIVPRSFVHHIVTLLNPKRITSLSASGASFRLGSDSDEEDASGQEIVHRYGRMCSVKFPSLVRPQLPRHIPEKDCMLPTISDDD